MNAFEYNRENLVDAYNRASDVAETLERLLEFVLAMGMHDTLTSLNLSAARGGLVAAKADLDRRIRFASE